MTKRKADPAANKAIRLSRLEITDFKALDRLVLDLHAPQMTGDPDVFVLGSRNGLGKTSLLEACALLVVTAGMHKEMRKEFLRMPRDPRRRAERHVDLPDLFVRSGEEKASIKAVFERNGEEHPAQLTVSRTGHLQFKPEEGIRLSKREYMPPPWEGENVLDSLASFSSEPLVSPPLLYFHSNRKVPEGSLELGAWVEKGSYSRFRRPGETAMSAFKVEILSLMMRKADLFEAVGNGKEESGQALAALNSFVERYAHGHIEKLRPTADNTADFRIEPTKGGQSYSFDGLSSGQKEVISTLFLVWRYTREAPAIILIDEPELHLNPEWQRDFVKQLHQITPESQFIIATHSQDIFGSVPEDRRILLGA